MSQTTTAVVAAADGGRQPQQGIGKSIQGIIRTHLQISNRFSKAKLLETMKKLLQKIFIIHLSCIPVQDNPSGVAGIILEISCCIAVRKLGSGRLSCPLPSVSIENILVQLMNSSYTLVSVGKLHHLASEAGFEEEFLLHFGTKILPTKSIEDIKFWIGLVQKKTICSISQRECNFRQTSILRQGNNEEIAPKNIHFSFVLDSNPRQIQGIKEYCLWNCVWAN